MTTREEARSVLHSAPACSRCGGTGYYVLDVPVTDPNFGVLMPCQCKQVEKYQRDVDRRWHLSNLDAFRDKTFETFDASVPGVREAVACARDYANRLEGWLVLFGPCGSGKTHLAAAIAHRALQKHYEIIFAVVPDLLDHLRSTFGPTSDVAYDKRFEDIREVPLLVLDDLGTENTTPWAREKLYQIINHRYNYRQPTIITTNRKPADIEPRILSRMSDRTLHEGIVSIQAGDYRPRADQRSGKRRRG